jgi:excisionase family DNA binding protein
VLGTHESIEEVGRSPRVDASAGDPGAPRGLTRSELMTAREVAELLGVPVSTVHEWGRNGTLPRVKLGRHVRFIRSHVEAAIFSAASNGR